MKIGIMFCGKDIHTQVYHWELFACKILVIKNEIYNSINLNISHLMYDHCKHKKYIYDILVATINAILDKLHVNHCFTYHDVTRYSLF